MHQLPKQLTFERLVRFQCRLTSTRNFKINRNIMRYILSLVLFACSHMLTATGQNCTAFFTADINDLDVVLTSQSFTDDGDELTFSLWSYGDGEELQGEYQESVTYSYAEPGVYEVCLAILTADFCEDQYCETLEILGPTCDTPTSIIFSSNDSQELALDWNGDDNAEGYLITITDLSGFEILTAESNTSQVIVSDPALQDCTDYLVSVQSDCGAGLLSPPSEATVATTACLGGYCASQGTDQDFGFIDYVEIIPIANESGDDGGYGNYTSQVTQLGAGQQQIIIVKPSATDFSQKVIFVFVDLNLDQDFDDPGEKLYESEPTTETVTATLDIPSDATLGESRMRVIVVPEFNAVDLDPCDSYPFGETEDYTAFIVDEIQPICSASFTDEPEPGGILFTSVSISTGNIISEEWTVNGEAQDAGTLLFLNTEPFTTYEVCLTVTTDEDCVDTTCQTFEIGSNCELTSIIDFTFSEGNNELGLFASANPDAVAYVFNIYTESGELLLNQPSGSPDTFVNSPLLEGCTDYLVTVTPVCEDGTAGIESVATGAQTACVSGYCDAAGENTNDEYCDSVSCNGVENQSGNNGGYIYFDNVPFQIGVNQQNTIIGTPGFNGNNFDESWAIFIDLNADEDFTDEGERVATAEPDANPQTMSFSIPSDTPLGTTRMRVMMVWEGDPENVDPCDNFTYGEVEDYLIEIVEELEAVCEVSFSTEPGDEGVTLTANIISTGQPAASSWFIAGEELAYTGEPIFVPIAVGEVIEVCFDLFTDDDCFNSFCDEVENPENACATPMVIDVFSDEEGVIILEVDQPEANNFQWFIYDANQELIAGEGGGGPGGGGNPVHEFDGGGGPGGGWEIEDCTVYYVSAIANCGGGEFSYETPLQQITSFCPGGCQASFEYVADVSGLYQFINTSGAVGNIVDYSWSTLGEEVSTDVNTEIFIEDQVLGQEVCLTITTDDDCVDSVCQIVTENPCATPIVLYVDSEEEGVIAMEVDGQDVNSYTWYIYDAAGNLLAQEGGGGPFGGGNDPYHEFVGGFGGPAGEWEVESCTTYFVAVSANCGPDGDSNISPQVEVVGYCPGGCVASYVYEPNPGGDYIFESESIAVGNIIEYIWSLDGEELLTSPVPNLGAGEDDVLGLELCLTIVTDDDCTDTFCSIITDNPCPTPILTNVESLGEGGIFAEVQEQEVNSFIWRIYDGNGILLAEEIDGGPFGGGDEPFHFFEGAGGYQIQDCNTYFISVLANCEDGGQSNESELFEVLANCPDGCIASFDVAGITGGEWSAQSTAAAQGEIISYSWTLDGEEVSTEDNAYIIGDPEAGGEICLSITTDDGCENQSCQELPISNCPAPTLTQVNVNDDGSVEVFADFGDAFGAQILVFDLDGNELGQGFTGGPGGGDPAFIDGLPECQQLFAIGIAFCAQGDASFASEALPFNSYCEGCTAGFIFDTIEAGSYVFYSTSTGLADIESTIWTVDGEVVSEEGETDISLDLASQPEVCISIVTADGCTDSYCETFSYCESTSEGSSEHITNVTLLALNNDSGNDDGYGDYTDVSTPIGLGQNAQISCTPGFDGGTYNEGFVVFIDYNQNLEFDLPQELVFQSEPSQETVTGEFTVPMGAAIGPTLMRVVMSFNGQSTDPCGVYQYGETEDYTVIIVDESQPFCSASFDLETGQTIEGNSTSFTTGNVDSYDWQVNGETVSTSPNFSIDAEEGEDYEICLTIISDDGCEDTACESFSNSCIADFEFEVDGLLVTFTNESSGFDSFSWEYGDGEVNFFDSDPVYEYDEEGQYTVCLTIFNDEGCSDEICQDIIVQEIECGAPEELSLVEATNASLTFDWGAAENASSYNYLLYTANPFSIIDQGNVNNTTLNLSGLEACTNYNLVVEAVCSTTTIPVELESVLTACDGADDCEASYESNGANSYSSTSVAGDNADITDYIWTLDGETVSTGFSDITVDLPTGASGEICLTIVTSQDCSNTFCGSVVDIEETREIKYHHYPNPSDHNTYFEFDGLQANLTLQILDITGRLMVEQAIDPGSQFTQIPTAEWPNGTYIYHLYSKQQGLKDTGRFVVQH